MRRCALGLAVVAAASVAHANGRPPATTGVFTREGDARTIYVATTFGLLVSQDDGCSFRWMCEQSIGYAGQFDPKYAIARDGTLYATTFTGLRVSRDGGCTWQTATAKNTPGPGGIAGLWVDALDLGPDDEVWVGTAQSGGTNNVYLSDDAARTFRPMRLRSDVIWWKSVRVAPSDARRIYVSGYKVAPAAADVVGAPPDEHPGQPATYVFRSDDRGATWTGQPLTGWQMASAPLALVEAVDPANPDHVFARSFGANPPGGDRLYRSTNGGATWTEVVATTDAIRRVLFTHDGKIIVATVASGVYESTNGGQTFEALPGQPQMACLDERSADGTLFACGSNWDPDFKALGRSSDAGRWDKVFRFVELAAPLSCPRQTAQYQTCEAKVWPTLQEQFGAHAPACAGPVVPDAAVPPVEHGGCCDARGEGAASAMIALVVMGLVTRRRCGAR